jgi:penicillin-binding protein 1A
LKQITDTLIGFFSKLKHFLIELRDNQNKRKLFLRKFACYSALSLGSVILLLTFFIISVWMGLFGRVPTKNELAAIENQLSSEIYALEGKLLGKYFIYDRSHAEKEQISENVFNCLIATEDVRFYKHRGIDYQSLGRVLFKTILLQQRSAGGGSTISQQLAKNLFSRNNNGFLSIPVSKVREMIIARRLEKIYEKDEILVLYLNTVPFAENVFGISAASLRFFNKNPHDLGIEEAAVLIGMLKAVNYFNPRLQPERAIGRRNIVIDQLRRYDFISDQSADSLRELPLKLNYNPITHNQGPAPYLREMLRLQIGRILSDYNQRNLTDYNLYTDGLKIYTTIDYNLQLLAEAAVKSQLSRQQKIMDNYYRNISQSGASSLLRSLMRSSERYKSLQQQKLGEKEIEEIFAQPTKIDLFSWEGPKQAEISPLDSIFMMQQVLHAGLVSIDPFNGHVRAWVGGNDFRFFQYDHVLAKRQAGSTFKPFLYATALQQGIAPCEYVSNEQKTYEDYDNWSPTNSRNEYEGFYSMTGALAHSINTVSAHYISLTGILPVIETARKSGITSQLPPVPSLALGTANVSLLELTTSYTVFLNEGKYFAPVWLLRIEDKDGAIIFQRKKEPSSFESLSPDIALMTRHMLQAVTDSGSASSLRYNHGLYGDLAGKTGTTQNNADTWFVGFSPRLITGVWTGVENPRFAEIFKSPMGSGSSAVPLWGDYYSRISRNPATRKYIQGSFSPLPDTLLARLDCRLYLDELPTENWWDDLFSPSDTPRERRRREQDERKRPSLRRWLESLFE